MNVNAPVKGILKDITEARDTVFSEKMIGDGMIIVPLDYNVCSPIDGIIESIFPTNHAFIIKSDTGIQLLVHIGLDTISLKGKPFKRLLEPGVRVKTGDPIILSDYKMISANGLDNSVIIVASDHIVSQKSELNKEYSINEKIFEVKE